MFHQTFQPFDLLMVALLVVLEGLLSIDNALVLGLLARRLPVGQQNKALTYGLIGAFIFRLVAIAFAVKLLQWHWVKLVGGAYLIYIAGRYLFGEKKRRREKHPLSEMDAARAPAFWRTVGAIEITDVAFAIDSILAAIALVGAAPRGTPAGALHPKFWVIATGGILGMVLMRFAAVIFIRLLERFPRFETSAYLLVALVGIKLIVDYLVNGKSERLNFQSPASGAFWAFWLLMAGCFAIGLLPRRRPG